MSTKLFVGSLAWATTDDSLQQFFSQAGTVVSAKVITDRMSGRSKGFGFVEMATEEEAKKAIEMLNGQMLDDRAIVVNEARPQEQRPQGGGYNSNRSGGSRGGYNNSRGGYNNNRSSGGYSNSRGGSYNNSNSRGSYNDDQSSSVPATDMSDPE